jgi:glycosyltransferase involved in cell wall biosynthesis
MQLKVLSSLPQVGRIRMLSLHEGQVGAPERRALAAEVAKLEVAEPVFHPIHLFRHRRRVPRVVWLRAVRGIPYMAAKWDSPAVRRALQEELARQEFDVVWLNGLGMAHYLEVVRQLQPRARVVLDQQNVEHDRFVQFARRQRGLRRIVAEAEGRAALRYEREVLRSVDAVGAISPDDARAFDQMAGVPSVVVPQVAPIGPRRESDAGARQLCWIGGLAWEPNVRGIEWLVREVWPRVRQRLPDVALDVVGAGLPVEPSGAPIVPPSWRIPGVKTIGFVQDLGPVYERSVAMVAPILGGTGIRIKLIEAFRHGLPVVTTPDGAAGLPIRAGQEAFIESDADAFAARVVELVTSSETRARLRDAGYRFLESHNRLPDAQAAIAALLGSESTPPTTSSQWRVPTIEHA